MPIPTTTCCAGLMQAAAVLAVLHVNVLWIQVQPGLLENSIAAEEAVLTWSCIRQRRRDAEQNLKGLVQRFENLQKKLRALPGHAHAAADQAITLLYCVTTEISGTGEPSTERDSLERLLWQAISEVQYISSATGCDILLSHNMINILA